MDIEKSFRHAQKVDDGLKAAIAELEDMFVDIAHDLDELPDSREKSLCMTHLQEAKFWAVECVAKI